MYIYIYIYIRKILSNTGLVTLERTMCLATMFVANAVAIDFIITNMMVSTMQKYGQLVN